MTNLTDLAVTSLTLGVINTAPSTQTLTTATGTISIKDGYVYLSRAGNIGDGALAAPVTVTDDYKHLVIMAGTAYAHTVTAAGGFSGGALTIATFGGAIGDTLELVAYGGKWHVKGFNAVTFA